MGWGGRGGTQRLRALTLPRFYLPRKFSRCSIDEYNQFLQEGGGSCLFNKPLKVPAPGGDVWERGLGRAPARLSTPLPRAAPGPARVRERLRGGGGRVRLWVGAGERLVRAPGAGRGRAPGKVWVGQVRARPPGPPCPRVPQECSRAGGNCCKKCTLTHDAMCSDGLCCRRCKVRGTYRRGGREEAGEGPGLGTSG